MSGLFRRLSSRRSAGPEGNEPPTAAEPGATDAPAHTPDDVGGRQSLLQDPAREDETTRILPGTDPHTIHAARPGEPVGPATHGHIPTGDPLVAQTAPTDPLVGQVPVQPLTPLPEPVPVVAAPPYGPGYPVAPGQPPAVPIADLPAGLDPDELAAALPTSARRGRLRRRIAFLRAARELLLRDLGGFVYELHRTAGDIEADAHRRLRETKLTRLARVDAELHELELVLDDVRRQVLVREPGVGGECTQCGELFSSWAQFCSNCGLPLTETAARQLARVAVAEPEPVIAPVPAAEPPIAPVADQPTEEIPPLDPDRPAADFQWPRRGNTPSTWTAEPSSLEGMPATADEPASVAAGEAPATSGAAVAGPDEATSESPDGAATPEPTATDEAATVAGGDDAPGAPAEAQDQSERTDRPSEGDDETPRNGSVFSPVERRP